MSNYKQSSKSISLKSKSFSDVKLSFFDDDDIESDLFEKNYKLWIKPQKVHLSNFKPQNILCEGFMAKKGKKIKRKKICFYFLTPEFLAFQEVIILVLILIILEQRRIYTEKINPT